MPALYGHHWSIFKAWKDWKVACLSFADSDVCSAYELKRRARYLGIPVAQLRWVSSYRPDPISLLERRMAALLLDPDEVAHMEPITVRELQQRCVKCKKPGQRVRSRRRIRRSRVAVLAGLLPECRGAYDAKHVPKLLEGLQIEQSPWAYWWPYAEPLPIDIARGRPT